VDDPVIAKAAAVTPLTKLPGNNVVHLPRGFDIPRNGHRIVVTAGYVGYPCLAARNI
jgi:hypothetical protein